MNGISIPRSMVVIIPVSTILCSTTQYDITMGNDYARNVYCDVTISNDVAMYTYQYITMDDIAMSLVYDVLLCPIVTLLLSQYTR